MNRKEFLKRRWGGYDRVNFTEPRTKEVKEMMIISINFDLEQMELIPTSPEYEQKSYFIDIKFLSIPPRKLSLVRGGGN